jgi:large subunit ribosomal protein L27
LKFHAGKNVGIGKDHTIFSLIDGVVKFEKYGPDKKKVINSLSQLDVCGL